MKRTNELAMSSKNTKASTTDLSIIARTFIYIALMQLKLASKGIIDAAVEMPESLHKVCAWLFTNEYIKLESHEKLGETKIFARISGKGGKLVARYFAACADELARGRFGKMKWDKRSKFHKAVMARIA